VFAILVALAAPAEGVGVVMPGLTMGIVVAMLVDAPILRMRSGAWEFPSGALLTAAIVVMILGPQEPWHVTAITSAIGVLSKYLVRGRTANVFNPAALALVVSFYLFNTAQSWWGALPELPLYALAVLVGAGAFITGRVNKAPMVLAFLGAYYTLFTITAFLGDAGQVAEIYRAPDLHMVLFFAFFILTDPPTSPTKYGHQIICGVIVAVVSYVTFEWIGAVYYLLAGVLAGNAWEAWRRYGFPWTTKRARPGRA